MNPQFFRIKYFLAHYAPQADFVFVTVDGFCCGRYLIRKIFLDGQIGASVFCFAVMFKESAGLLALEDAILLIEAACGFEEGGVTTAYLSFGRD